MRVGSTWAKVGVLSAAAAHATTDIRVGKETAVFMWALEVVGVGPEKRTLSKKPLMNSV
jgi:hypothetical protein